MEPNTPATQAFPQGDPVQDDPSYSSQNRDDSSPNDSSPNNQNPNDQNHNDQNRDDQNQDVAKPARPRGPNVSAVVLGVAALALAALIIVTETTSLKVDWSRLGPGAIVGVGALLVVLGAVGLVRRRHDDG